MSQQARARVGTSAWHKPPWRGKFYPQGLPQAEELHYAADRLATLEINTTFHGLKTASSFRSWHAQTPNDFVFSVKASKTVTHDHSLRNPEKGVAEFLNSGVLTLGRKLGAVLWQIPETLPFHRDTVDSFLAVLPHSVDEARRLILEHYDEVEQTTLALPDAPIRHAFEVRHSSFDTPGFTELLHRHDVAAAFTNSPGWPPIREITSDFVYLRLHGSLEHFPNGYDTATLDRWAEKINGWLRGDGCPDGRPRDVLAYFDNPDHEGTRSPLDAIALQQRLDGPAYGVGQTIQTELF
jgi:uncharacterized protein YecE (DUF72 family)